MSIIKHLNLLTLITFLSLPMAATNWNLDNSKSNISFISVKNSTVAEIHTFKQLNGTIDSAGKVALSIMLDSIESMIPIRNERMRSMLFNTQSFPVAAITATPNMTTIKDLKAGASQTEIIAFQLKLHGQTQSYQAQVQITLLDSHELMVNTVSPIIINAADFKLIKGITRLQEIAGLSSIAKSIPVTFQLQFGKSNSEH